MNEIQHLIIIQSRLERIERLLKKKQEDDTYMQISEASKYTTFSISTLRRAIESGELSCISQGGRGTKIILKKSSLTEWMES
tara:strand:+ start:186 stop:431 length:246 start_codon:yes stop_codon:yes gene_type:complete